MKPSQFLYSESIKDQKAQKANVTKSIGELKPLPKTANPPKEQNSSMIYSLVNLPFKEGQNDQVIFPQALISQHMKVDPKVVVGKNTEIARSLKKLKPLETLDEAPKPSTAKLGIPDQQLQGPKLQTYLKVLNDLTNGLFKKTQSQLLFGSVEQKVGKNTALCVLRIQQLKFFNEYNQKNDKIPALFSWEALYRKKSLMKTTPKEFDAAQQDLLDFLYPRNSYESVDIVLWKIKNNDEKYIGQFDLSNEDYQNSKEVLDFKSKYITEKFLEKEMFKSMKQTKSYIGNVRFQLIQLADDKIPLNKHSGIPGSPRTEEEKARHRIIDAAMSGSEYRWSVDDQERIVIQKIDSITKEIIAETTIETVEDECGNLLLVFETKYADPETCGRSRPNTRQMKKQQFEAQMNLVKELDKTGVFTEVQGTLRGLSRQGKLTRKAIDDALQAVGCTANQLLLTPCGEFGDCFMDFLINTDDLPGVLEAMQEIKIVGEDELNLESISNNLFQNIGQHMRKNINLKSIIDFIKALEKKPEVGLLIFNYSYASENILSATPPFLQNFDSRNYEHVMILSKLNKLIAKFKIDTKFTRALKQAHTEAKKAIYFEIPCFPKDLDLDDKADSLQLKGLGQNVLHEVVRRQKWNKSHVIFEKYPEWFFVADEQEHTPFSLMLEQAPFDVIKSLFAAYPEQLQNVFNKFNPNENMFESRVPKKQEEKKEEKQEEKQEGEGEKGEEKPKKAESKEPNEDDEYAKRKENAQARRAFGHFKEQKEYRKNLVHSLLLNTNVLNNSDATLADLKDVLRNLELLVNQSNENNFEVMKTQKLRAGDFTPLGLFLEIIRSKLKRKLDRVQREISSTILICQMLTPNIDEEENQAGAEQQEPKSTFQWTLENQLVISQVIAKFPEHIFERLDEERFAKQIQWIPNIEGLKTIRYINLPCRALVKHKQQHKLFSIIQQMQEDLRNIQYNAEDPEADDNKKLFYYFQIPVLMLMDIRNLRSQKLDQVATQIMTHLRDFTLVYPQLLVEKMPKNITDSYYPFSYQYKSQPQTILEMLNLIKYNILLTDIPLQYLDKLDNTNLGDALFRCKDQESLRDFIKLYLAKYKPESEEQAEQNGLYKFILDPQLIFGEQAAVYLRDLNKSQLEQLLLTYKEKMLPVITKYLSETNATEKMLNLILRSFQNRKSVGITQQQVALWIRSDLEKINKGWVIKFVQHFRSTMSLQQIHTLIDLELPKQQFTYHNQAKIFPYLQAQGRNWAQILELRKFAAALKDNIQYIDIERTLKCVAVNGQYEKMELVLPYVKDSALIKSTIHFVSKIAGLQIFNQKEYYSQGNPKKRKAQPEADEGKEDEAENNEGAAGDGGNDGGDDGGDGGGDGAPKIASIATKPVQQQSETQKKVQPKIESKKEIKMQQQSNVNDLADFYIRCYDPTVYFFKTSIKEKKEKYKIEQVKFPEALDQLRTPLSLQDQLKEMSPAIQLEIDDFLRSQFPKCNLINLSNYEKMIERDVVMFRYLKNWKSSLQRQNLRSVFTPYDSGAGLQSYKKTLTQLVKQFQRYGMPMCETLEEFQQTLQVFMTYGILNMEQIIFQVASSKLTPKEKNQVLIHLLKTVLGSSYLHPLKEYEVRKKKEIFLQLAQHYQQKNANTYLSQVNRIIKSINVKQFDEDLTKDFESTILATITTIFSVLKPDMLNDVKVLHFKLASEILQRLDQIDIKTLFQEQLVNISKIIKTRQLKDKQLLALANKYNPERIEQALKPSHRDVITLFKKQKLEEALSTDIVTYLQKYSDSQCEEIVTELFKLPYDKSFREELIGKFNKELFEALIFFRKYRTYNKLINDILLKQLLKGKEDEQAKFIVKINGTNSGSKIQQNLANSQVNEQSKIEQQQPESDAPQVEAQQEENEDSKEYSIPQLALFFNFYEYFDTLHRLRIKIEPLEAFNGNRFRLQSNEQLQVLATQYEQQGLNYISNCIKMLRYLRLNHYNGKNNQQYLETSLITAFVTKGYSRWLSQSTNLIQEYLKISERQIPYWNENLIEKKQTINFGRLKINGIERGVKFCFPSNYTPGDKGEITSDDIRKTPVKRPVFTVDQYVENLPSQSTPRLDNQMLNDPEFTSVLSKLLLPFKQPEYLIDKQELFETIRNFEERDESVFYYLVNFPTFWYEEKIPKENLLNRYLFNDFELGIIVLRSVLQLEPKMSDQILDLYFLSLKEEAKGAEQEEEADQEEKEESEYEEYEVEVTDDEAEIEQNQEEEPQQQQEPVAVQEEKEPDLDEGPQLRAVDEKAPKPRGGADEAPQARAPQAEQVQAAPEAQQAQQPKVKKTKKVMQKRKIQKGDKPQQWVEPKTSLNTMLQDSCNSLQYFQIFLQLLLFASTNEEAFRLVQKYFIQYEVVSPLTTPAEIDPIRKARLIKDGFKEPFNQQFLDQMESKAKELKNQQIEDLKHIQEVLTINEKRRHSEQSEVYQVLLKAILKQSQVEAFNGFIVKLLNSAPFKLLTKHKKQVFSHSLEKDQKLQLELRNYFAEVDKIQLAPDVIVKFFENSKQVSNQSPANDKWVNILYILKYCQEISKQVKQFTQDVELQKEKLSSYRQSVCDHYQGNKFVEQDFDVDLKYNFKFKVANKFEPLIYEYKIENNPENPDSNIHKFNFELTFNIIKNNPADSPFPTAQLSQKYAEEVFKTIDTLYYDNYINCINELCSYPQLKVAQISGSDNIDYIQLKTKLTKENFREYVELHYQNNFFLDDTITGLQTYENLLEGQEINNLKILTQLREGIIVSESNEFTQPVKINGQDWNLYSERMRPDIKLKYQDKLYPVPYSNYQPRQRNTQYKQSIQVDQSFPELYPLVNLQVYQYIPDVMTEEQFSQKYDSLAAIQQACYDLNSYAQSLDEFISSSPSEEELQNLREVAPQVVSWPIIRQKVKREKGFTEQYKFIHSQEAHPLYMIEYLYRSLQFKIDAPLKFTFNVLSVTEMIVFKLTRILQQTTGKKCKLQTTISILEEWTLLKKILLKIADLLQGNELDKFKFYYVEFNEVHQNSVYQLKSNKFEGLDTIFRFGQTNFFVHSNVLIIRLNFAVISENATGLITMKNPKLRSYESSHLLFKEDKDLRGYISQIVTLEDMLKQIFTKK